MAIFRKKPTEEQSTTAQDFAKQNVVESSDDHIRSRVEPIISQLRPYLQADGGDIELVGVEDAVVYVRLQGACSGCPSSLYTLKMGVEARIIEEVPEVRSVEMA
ncbi:MAG: NifU family protein [Candidatus Sumerlaeaceae bacterium]|jgi:Fe-S cluster biogenesis protein NfuA